MSLVTVFGRWPLWPISLFFKPISFWSARTGSTYVVHPQHRFKTGLSKTRGPGRVASTYIIVVDKWRRSIVDFSCSTRHFTLIHQSGFLFDAYVFTLNDVNTPYVSLRLTKLVSFDSIVSAVVSIRVSTIVCNDHCCKVMW